jgi:hypothetical protein
MASETRTRTVIVKRGILKRDLCKPHRVLLFRSLFARMGCLPFHVSLLLLPTPKMFIITAKNSFCSYPRINILSY